MPLIPIDTNFILEPADHLQELERQAGQYHRSDDSGQFARGWESSGLSETGNRLLKKAMDARTDNRPDAAAGYERRGLGFLKEAARWAPRVQSIRDVQGMGDLADWAAGAAGNLRSSIKPAIGGLVGGLVGTVAAPFTAGVINPVSAGFTGAALAGYGPMKAEGVANNYLDPQVRATKSLQEIDRATTLGALGSSALEAAVPFGMTGKVLGSFGKNGVARFFGQGVTQAERAAERAAMGVERRALFDATLGGKALHTAKGMGIGAAEEFATEGAQSLVGQAVHNSLLDNDLTDFDYGQAFDEAAAGAVSGGLMGGVGHGSDVVKAHVFAPHDPVGFVGERIANGIGLAGKGLAKGVQSLERALAAPQRSLDALLSANALSPELATTHGTAWAKKVVGTPSDYSAEERQDAKAFIEAIGMGDAQAGVRYRNQLSLRHLTERNALADQTISEELTRPLGGDKYALSGKDADAVEQAASLWRTQVVGEKLLPTAGPAHAPAQDSLARTLMAWVGNGFADLDGAAFIPESLTRHYKDAAPALIERAVQTAYQTGLVGADVAARAPEVIEQAKQQVSEQASAREVARAALPEIVRDTYTEGALAKLTEVLGQVARDGASPEVERTLLKVFGSPEAVQQAMAATPAKRALLGNSFERGLPTGERGQIEQDEGEFRHEGEGADDSDAFAEYSDAPGAVQYHGYNGTERVFDTDVRHPDNDSVALRSALARYTSDASVHTRAVGAYDALREQYAGEDPRRLQSAETALLTEILTRPKNTPAERALLQQISALGTSAKDRVQRKELSAALKKERAANALPADEQAARLENARATVANYSEVQRADQLASANRRFKRLRTEARSDVSADRITPKDIDTFRESAPPNAPGKPVVHNTIKQGTLYLQRMASVVLQGGQNVVGQIDDKTKVFTRKDGSPLGVVVGRTLVDPASGGEIGKLNNRAELFRTSTHRLKRHSYKVTEKEGALGATGAVSRGALSHQQAFLQGLSALLAADESFTGQVSYRTETDGPLTEMTPYTPLVKRVKPRRKNQRGGVKNYHAEKLGGGLPDDLALNEQAFKKTSVDPKTGKPVTKTHKLYTRVADVRKLANVALLKENKARGRYPDGSEYDGWQTIRGRLAPQASEKASHGETSKWVDEKIDQSIEGGDEIASDTDRDIVPSESMHDDARRDTLLAEQPKGELQRDASGRLAGVGADASAAVVGAARARSQLARVEALLQKGVPALMMAWRKLHFMSGHALGRTLGTLIQGKGPLAVRARNALEALGRVLKEHPELVTKKATRPSGMSTTPSVAIPDMHDRITEVLEKGFGELQNTWATLTPAERRGVPAALMTIVENEDRGKAANTANRFLVQQAKQALTWLAERARPKIDAKSVDIQPEPVVMSPVTTEQWVTQKAQRAQKVAAIIAPRMAARKKVLNLGQLRAYHLLAKTKNRVLAGAIAREIVRLEQGGLPNGNTKEVLAVAAKQLGAKQLGALAEVVAKPVEKGVQKEQAAQTAAGAVGKPLPKAWADKLDNILAKEAYNGVDTVEKLVAFAKATAQRFAELTSNEDARIEAWDAFSTAKTLVEDARIARDGTHKPGERITDFKGWLAEVKGRAPTEAELDAFVNGFAGEQETTKYSLSDDAGQTHSEALAEATAQWAKVLQSYENGTLDYEKGALLFPSTPASMQVLGAPNMTVRLFKHALDYINERFSKRWVEKLPTLLADPKIVFALEDAAEGKPGLVFVLKDGGKVNDFLAVVLRPNSVLHAGAGPVNYVATIKPMSIVGARKYAREGRTLYVGDVKDMDGVWEQVVYGKQHNGKSAKAYRQMLTEAMAGKATEQSRTAYRLASGDKTSPRSSYGPPANRSAETPPRHTLPAVPESARLESGAQSTPSAVPDKIMYKADLVKLIENGAAKYSMAGEGAAPELSLAEKIKLAADEIYATVGDTVATLYTPQLRKKGAQGSWTRGELKNTISIALLGENIPRTVAHELMHEFFDILKKNGDAATIALLERVAMSPLNNARLERLLSPAGAAQVVSSPEEAVAHMYGLWREGKFKIGGKIGGLFSRIKNFFANVLGLVSDEVRRQKLDERQVNALFEALVGGAFRSLKGDFTRREAALGALKERMTRHAEQLDALDVGGKKLAASVVGTLFYSAGARLDSSGNAALRTIRELFDPRAGQAMGQQGFYEGVRQQGNIWASRLTNILAGFDDETRDLARKALATGSLGHDALTTSLVVKLRGYLDDMGAYITKRGVARLEGKTWRPVTLRKNYFPRVWNVTEVGARFAEFRDLLLKHHPDNLKSMADALNEQLESMRSPGYVQVGKLDPLLAEALNSGRVIDNAFIADALTQMIASGSGYVDIGETVTSLGVSPMASAVNQRKFNWIDAALFDSFMEQDLTSILSTYTHTVVKRAEWTRVFDFDSSRLRDLYDHATVIEAFGKGLANDIAKAIGGGRVDAHRKTGLSSEKINYTETDEDGVERAMSYVASRAHREATYLEIAAEKIVEHVFMSRLDAKGSDQSGEYEELYEATLSHLLEARKKLEPAGAAIQAMEGTLGREISPKLRSLNSALMTAQNVIKLPLTLFMQFNDVMGVVANGGELSDAWKTFTGGMREVLHSWKGTVSNDKAAQRAELWGTTDASLLLSSIGQTYGSMYMTGKMRKFNDTFFRVIGMEGWNRGTRIVATQVAERAIVDYQKNGFDKGDAAAQARFETLFGKDFDPAQIALDTDGELDLNNAANQAAVLRWVNNAIMSPNAAHRTVWGSDTRMAAFWQFKQFGYTFQQVMLKNMIAQAKLGNLRPISVLLLGYAPTAIAAGAVKEMLVPGDEPPWMKMGLGSYIAYGVSRSGMFGVPGMSYESVTGYDGPVVGVLKGLGGPSVGQAYDALVDPLGKTMLGVLPAGSLLRRAY